MAMHPARQAYVEEEKGDTHIDIANIPTDTNYQLPSLAAGQQSQNASTILYDMARKRKAAALAVPTDDQRVRSDLRARGEPITLFGERKEDRRDRLRELMLKEQEAGGDEDESMADLNEVADEEAEEGEFYIEGSQELLAARRDIARYSLPRTAQRIAFQRLESQIPVGTHVRHRKAIKEKLGEIELFGSQIASERPVGIVRFAPNGELLACGDWSGSVKLLDVPNLETKATLRGHKGNSMVGGLTWFPGGTLHGSSVSPENVNLASSASDGEIYLWSLTQDTPLAALSGHTQRVCRTEFHPSGRYLASAGYDTTWRLWDVNTTTELLLQEGHSKEVHTVSFNEDGNLIASAGLDSYGRIWDIRSGRTVMLLEGHVQPIYALDWNSDGFRAMTGSADGLAKCWDLRAVRESADIGAHLKGVCDLKWYKGNDGPFSDQARQADATMANGDADHEQDIQPKKSGSFVVSSGFDSCVNVWSADDWALCKSLTGHNGPVLAVDVTADGKLIASCGRDRTIKFWARDDMGSL